MRKVLSLLLALLMVVSCVPATMFVGAFAAEETEAPEATDSVPVSYKDPREGASKVYYALAGGLKESELPAGDDFNADNLLVSGYNLYGVLTDAAVNKKTDYEPGSVLVVKFKGDYTGISGDNAGLKRSSKLALGASTIFRSDGSKLPIVIEGVEANRASKVSFVSNSLGLQFANDYYFTNLTFFRNHNGTAGSTLTLYAGSGEITFDNVNFDLTGNVVFAGDNYNSDAFYDWDETKFKKNKNEAGFISTGYTFGKNSPITNTATVFTAVAADGHSNTTAYKDLYVPAKDNANTEVDETVLTADKVAAVKTAAGKVLYSNGKLITTNTKGYVLPGMTSTYIAIDNGKVAGDTADFGTIYARKGCNPVGNAEVILKSGTVNTISVDHGTGSTSAREIYTGDITVTVDGGKVITGITGLNFAHVIGDYTLRMNGGYIERIDGTAHIAKNCSIADGSYLFETTGGELNKYYGGLAIFSGEGTATNRIAGGEFLNTFYASRYPDVNTTIYNEISDGLFRCTFYGGTGNGYEIGSIVNDVTGGEFKGYFVAGTTSNKNIASITNNISGGTFGSTFYGAYYGAQIGTITNNISAGAFNAVFYGGAASATKVGTVLNNISGHYNDTHFAKAFYTGSAKNTDGTVTTNISGAQFDAAIAKGGATATNHSINVISEKATDAIKFQNVACTFDKFEMNGGTVHFYKSTVTANNAKGDVIVRNIGAWEAGKTYFTFTPAEGATLNVTTTQYHTIPTRGCVKVVGGQYLVQAETDGISPTGATLILKERIAVKFIFAKADVEAIGVENFDFAVTTLDGTNLLPEGAQLVKDGDEYTLTTKGIGLPDATSCFTLSGSQIKDSGFSIATLADAAITKWEGNWKTWATALRNLVTVAVENKTGTLTPADKDYGTRTATRDEAYVTGATASLLMSSAVGVKLDVTFATVPATPVVKVNGKEIAGAYAIEGNNATVTLYFAPQAMEKEFTVTIFDGEAEVLSLTATVAGFAKELNTPAANALLAYIQATTEIATAK